MRMFGLIGLVLALVVVGLLVKKQLGVAAAPAPASAGVVAPAGASPQQIQQEFKQKLDAAMQQPRALPDDGN